MCKNLLVMENFEPNDNFGYFLYWVNARMEIFWNKIDGNSVLTTDNILLEHKFTNVYRSLDRVSQYFIKEILNKDNGYSREDMFWRILLFKHFNKIETWEYLIKELGDITLNISIEDILKKLYIYKKNKYIIYNNAFMQTAPFMGSKKFIEEYELQNKPPKYESYLKIFYKHFIERGNIYKVLNSKSLEELFNKLSETPAFANFLSMQYTTDLNWSNLFNFNENSFIVESVGSQRGIERCFNFNHKVKPYKEIIKWTHKNLFELFDIYGEQLGIKFDFKPLPNYPPTLMDIQNCYCETDKYLRGLGQPDNNGKLGRIKQKYKPINSKIKYVFPKKWNLKI